MSWKGSFNPRDNEKFTCPICDGIKLNDNAHANYAMMIHKKHLEEDLK